MSSECLLTGVVTSAGDMWRENGGNGSRTGHLDTENMSSSHLQTQAHLAWALLYKCGSGKLRETGTLGQHRDPREVPLPCSLAGTCVLAYGSAPAHVAIPEGLSYAILQYVPVSAGL